jgi:hypothetical protein
MPVILVMQEAIDRRKSQSEAGPRQKGKTLSKKITKNNYGKKRSESGSSGRVPAEQA